MTKYHFKPNAMNPEQINVLIACEYSGVVRDAFIARGFNAMSCDLLPTEKPGPHYQGNVFDIIGNGWDLMIAHPPCTYLSYAANKYWNAPGRVFKRLKALDFFAMLLYCDIPRICVENPLGVADAVIRKHDQIIHPYFFGDSEMKRTCFWLKNLPLLKHAPSDSLFYNQTHVAPPAPTYVDKSGKKRYFTDAISGQKKGGHLRSASFPGIARAMAAQWGDYILEQKTIVSKEKQCNFVP